MALTYLEEQRKKQQAQPAQQSGLSGVSQNTQAQLQRYQQGYQPSQQVQQAQQQMNAVQQQKPQTYNSKYSAALDNILQTIQNPGSFKYEFNNDGLFRSYADLFTQQAKQAQANAQGNAAALTGGYGNSYGAAAGAQAYQQAILPLYDRGMELAQFARDNYDKDRQAPYDQLNALQGMDERDYGRYQDQLADWRTDQGIAREDYQTERTFDNDAYNRALDYWTGQAQAENADMRADQDENFRNAQLAEQIRSTDLDEQYRRDAMDYDQAADARNFAQSQYEFEQNSKLDWANLEEKQREYDASLSADEKAQNQKYAVAWVTDILANGQIPSMELLIAAGLSYEDAQKLVAQVQVGGGPGKTGDDDEKSSLADDIENGKYNLRDTITPEERREFIDWHNSTGGDQGPQYAPKTSNLETPVTLKYSTGDKILGTIGDMQKTTTPNTTTMNPITYNAMIQKMMNEELRKNKK